LLGKVLYTQSPLLGELCLVLTLFEPVMRFELILMP
jgi:hypothetical protein